VEERHRTACRINHRQRYYVPVVAVEKLSEDACKRIESV